MTAGLRYGVEIRAAQAADAPEVARLLLACGLSVSDQDAAQRLEATRTMPGAAVLVAAGYGGLSGLVALCWAPVLHEPRPMARITALAVHAEERRRGIGRLLLKAASQAARAAGCDVIELIVPPGHAAAAGFSQASGFLPQGEVASRLLRKKP